jgi:hypothetical protein
MSMFILVQQISIFYLHNFIIHFMSYFNSRLTLLTDTTREKHYQVIYIYWTNVSINNDDDDHIRLKHVC